MSDAHDTADNEGLAWLETMTQGAGPATPVTVRVDFMRALVERLRRAEAGLAAIRKLEREGGYCSWDLDLDRVLKEHGA